jgi:hypothetical protein
VMTRSIGMVLSACLVVALPFRAQDDQGKEKSRETKKEENSKADKASKGAAPQRLASIIVEVKGKQSQQAMGAVEVFLSVAETDWERTTSTDDSGRAEFKQVPRGPALVQATKEGWRTAGTNVDLSDATRTISLVMEQKQ